MSEQHLPWENVLFALSNGLHSGMLTSKPCRGPVGDPKTRDMSFWLPLIVVALIGVYSYLIHVSIRLPQH